VQPAEDGAHLVPREHDGQPRRPPGANHVVDPRHVDPEDVAIQEEHRAERLVLRGGGHVAVGGECARECGDRLGPELPGMALAMEEDEATDPADVRLLRPAAVVARVDDAADLVE
jgi:hypothetical protein